ncbi:MAG TPA: cytochrome c [Roseiarcus sp.]|nr:cytochrome c [Roseiarcus sp.]
MNRRGGLLLFALLAASPTARADDPQIERGKYLVQISGCSDCHTPGGMLGQPDMARYLGGSDVGFAIPGVGIYLGQNLTPDQETGLGAWSDEQIIAAIRTGKRPDGRTLSEVMPYPSFAHLTDQDAQAIAAFLKSLPPIRNKVPGPFGPNEKATTFVSVVISAGQYNNLPPAK